MRALVFLLLAFLLVAHVTFAQESNVTDEAADDIEADDTGVVDESADATGAEDDGEGADAADDTEAEGDDEGADAEDDTEAEGDDEGADAADETEAEGDDEGADAADETEAEGDDEGADAADETEAEGDDEGADAADETEAEGDDEGEEAGDEDATDEADDTEDDASEGEDSTYQRTVIFLEKQTMPGEDVFFRGGNHICNDGSGCPIDIRHRELSEIEVDTPARNAWAEGDTQLDWNGGESGQGNWNGQPADGSPGQWTTSDSSQDYHHLMNRYGEHFWVLDVDMDCSQTSDGYFDFKGFSNGQWESDISGGDCPTSTITGINHVGRCGHINKFYWNQGSCEIEPISE